MSFLRSECPGWTELRVSTQIVLDAAAGLGCEVEQLYVGLAFMHHEAGTQRFVTGPEAIEAGTQRRSIERSRQTQGQGDVVGLADIVELSEEPQALLGEGQRQRSMACDGLDRRQASDLAALR